MTNYYTEFRKFKEQRNLNGKMLLDTFEKEMIIFFGFGGRNKTVSRWLENFQNVGFIKIEKDSDDIWFVTII
jgi:hypothetical protein